MRIQKDIIFLLGSLLVITIAWVTFNIRHNAVTSTISESLNQDITPITPNFNTNVIEELKTRQLVDPSYAYTLVPATAQTQTATPTATPTISLTPIPTQTISETPTETPSPTP